MTTRSTDGLGVDNKRASQGQGLVAADDRVWAFSQPDGGAFAPRGTFVLGYAKEILEREGRRVLG